MATTKVTTDVIDMSGNAGGLTWVKGTTAQRPSGVIGEIRENTETNRTEVYTNQVGTPPSISTCDYPAGAGAQALYQFDTATLTTDTCGNYSAGTNNNVTQNTTVKKFGTSSAEFNGTTADIDLESGLDSTTMSVSFWIYIDATITTNGVVVELENGYGVWFIASASGKLGVQNNNANNEATLSNAQLGTGAWHHVAAVWTGVGGSSNRTFYLDNVVQTGGTVNDYLTCNENTLGSRRSGEFFDGYLDQVRFYNTALTASQVDDLFNETSTSTGNEWRNLKEADLPILIDYLLVAGGGGGGGHLGGGGGAGGLRTSFSDSGGGQSAESKFSVSLSTNYTVEVGPGGNAGVAISSNSTAGTDSKFGTVGSEIVATGGGGGLTSSTTNTSVNNGGSGGGGGGYNSAGPPNNNGSAVTSPAIQGFDGGLGSEANTASESGGGGGAAVVGGTATSSAAGAGGAGLAVNIINASNAATASVGEVSGSDVYFAGGGGGGADARGGGSAATGGIGGGGAGIKGYSNATDGSPNNGAGGGGGSGGAGGTGSNGGAGGSGVIILRYPSSLSITVGAGIQESTGSPFTEGLNLVSVFTSGTGTITFS